MPSEKTAEELVHGLKEGYCPKFRDKTIFAFDCFDCVVTALKSFAAQEVEKQKRKDAEIARLIDDVDEFEKQYPEFIQFLHSRFFFVP